MLPAIQAANPCSRNGIHHLAGPKYHAPGSITGAESVTCLRQISLIVSACLKFFLLHQKDLKRIKLLLSNVAVSAVQEDITEEESVNRVRHILWCRDHQYCRIFLAVWYRPWSVWHIWSDFERLICSCEDSVLQLITMSYTNFAGQHVEGLGLHHVQMQGWCLHFSQNFTCDELFPV